MPAVPGNRWLVVGAAWLALLNRAGAEPVPLAVDHGHCECVVATPNASDQFYLIVGSLAAASQNTQVSVRTDAAGGPEYLPLEKSTRDPSWTTRVQAQADFLARLRRERPTADRFPPPDHPPAAKIFHLFTGERDLENPANYQAVHANLAAVGRRAQIYLDREDRDVTGIERTLAEVLRIFDQELWPWADQNLGRVLDVDRDGRFTILLTGTLGTLQNGKVQVDGFVRGSDFFRDLPAPFSNHCDMLYLNAALKPGPQLRTVMFHEYTHAVTFCEHALTSYPGQKEVSPPAAGSLHLGALSSFSGPTNVDEESWLNEGVAHLVETQNDGGWSNLDYRISAFLARPERYPLVVPDYFGAGLWRNPGTRGAAFLFLRSCQAQSKGDLTRRLIQTPLRGIDNLEVASQKPFAELFRQAAVDLLEPMNYGYLDKNHLGLLLCGPRFQEINLDNGRAACTLAGTTAAFFQLHTPAGTHARVQVDGAGPLQVTLVRTAGQVAGQTIEVSTPPPRLSLRWVHEAESLRLELSAQHGDVRLRGAAWENTPEQERTPANRTRWFDQERVPGGGSIYSVPLTAPPARGTEAVLKVLGEDTQGRPVAAWIACP